MAENDSNGTPNQGQKFRRGGEGARIEKTPLPSSKMTDGQCITAFKEVQSLQKHSPGPQRAKAGCQNSPRVTVPEELRWLLSEKDFRPSQIFLLMREYTQQKRRLSDAVECTKARLKALSPREVFAYLRALSKAPTDFSWILREKTKAVSETEKTERVQGLRSDVLRELDGKFLVNAKGAIHRVEAQVESAEVWWKEEGSGRVKTGFIPINAGFLEAVIDGRLKRIDAADALAKIQSGFAATQLH